MPPQEELSDFIRRFDVNENGVLDFQEFSSIIRALGQTPAYLGERSFRRVVSAHLRERRTIKLWRDVFNKLDAPPRSGKLDVYELCQAFDSLSFGIQLTRARRLIAKYDTNGDECLNFDEFKVRRGTRRPPLCRRRDSAGGCKGESRIGSRATRGPFSFLRTCARTAVGDGHGRHIEQCAI
eukprot:7389530-Prymnesium_polylepis.2